MYKTHFLETHLNHRHHPYAVSSSGETAPTQKNRVKRAPVDIREDLKKRNFRTEKAEFQKHQQESWKQFQEILLQSQR